MPTFKTAYGPKERVHPATGGESRTHQSFKEQCDVNAIVSRFKKTGVISTLNPRPARFADVSQFTDYRDVVHEMMRAERIFMQLPASVRGRFGHDAAAFLEFAADPGNVDELRDMGLVAPPDSEGSEGLSEPAAEGGGTAEPDESE